MSTTFELIDVIRRQIDDRIASLTNNLISAPSDKHDRLAGEIHGLRSAQAVVVELGRKWGTASFDETEGEDEHDGFAH